MSSVAAATAAISVPAHWISVPAGEITFTAVTPLVFSAALMSMEVTRACAWGEVSTAPKSMPGRLMSGVTWRGRSP